MTITAKFSGICPCCNTAIRAGEQVEWTKGSKARHPRCANGSTQVTASTLTRRAPRTCCVGCGGALDQFQIRRGLKFCSKDCVDDMRLGGQSGYVGGVWHQGSDD